MASQTYTSSGTHVVGDGVTKVIVEARAGGGGSGNASATFRGGGGKGGGYARSVLSVNGGDSHVVTVGNGGGVASAGGNSVFRNAADTADLVRAAGGNGGTNATAFANGTGATTHVTTHLGDVTFNGGNGQTGGTSIGGGGAGDAGDGGQPTGGTDGGGDGGAGTGTGQAGNPGTIPSGAASGGAPVSQPGASGARGEVKITEVFEINVSESITVTENTKTELIHYISRSESTTVSESTKFTIVYPVNVSDSVAVSDTSGSTNLITGTFEAGTEGWLGVNATTAVTTDQAFRGTQSLKATTGAGGFNVFSTTFAVSQNTRYGVAAWFRTAATARAIQLTVNWYATSELSSFISSSNAGLVADSASSWTRSEFAPISPAGANFALVLATYGNSATNEVHYIDNVVFGAYNVNLAVAHNPSVSDSVAVSESHKEELIHLVNKTESIAASESHKEELIHYITEEENISVTDTPNVTEVFNTSVSDSIEVTENKAFTLVVNTSVDDSITVSESTSLLKVLLVDKSESITVTEALGFTVVNNITVSENLSDCPPAPSTPSQYILTTNGKLAVLVADISPYPLYQEL